MVLFSFLLITLYIIYFVIKYEIPHSLSATYYYLKNKWIFSAVLAVSSLMILPIMLSSPYSFLCFFGVTGVLFVSATPNFRDNELVDSVHTWSAIISLISLQLWVGLTNSISLCVWIPFLIYLSVQLFKYKSLKKILEQSNIKFYAEIFIFLSVYLILFFN